MATVDTISPSVESRDHEPPIGQERNLAGELDLAETPSWSFLSSFAFPTPDHFEFTYDDGDVSLDITAGRVARTTDSGQRILSVGSVTGLKLKDGTVNYVYFTSSDDIESRDTDDPPGPGSLLIGTVDPRDGTTNTKTRGRSPISQFITEELDSSSESDSSRVSTDETDLADQEREFVREFVPDGFVLRCDLLGVMDDSLTTTSGLSAQIVDESDGTVYATTEQKRDSRSPPEKVFGPADVRLEAYNNSGGPVTSASARFEYDIVTGEPPGLAVDTIGADNITSDSADLTGDLRSLGQSATADVSHEYRPVGGSFTQTAADTLSSPQQFTDAVSGLSAGTDYEFRALADGSDGSNDQGVLVTFTTDAGVIGLIDDFEDNNLNEWTKVGGVGSITTSTAAAFDGTYGAEISTSSATGLAGMVSVSGGSNTNDLAIYPEPGTEFVLPFEFDTTDQRVFAEVGKQTESVTGEGIFFRKFNSGDLIVESLDNYLGQSFADAESLINTKLQFRGVWDSDGDIEVSIEDYNGGTTHAAVSGSDTSVTDKGIHLSTIVSSPSINVYWDELEIVSSTASVSPNSNIPKSDIEMWLAINRGTGSTVYDIVNRDNSYSPNGASWDSSGVAANCLRFDGTDDFLPLPAFSTFNQFTFSLWVNVDSGALGSIKIAMRIENNNQIRIDKLSDDTIRGFFFDGSNNQFVSSSTISADTWRHVAITWDGSTFKLYMDGTEVDSTSTGSGMGQRGRPNSLSDEFSDFEWGGRLDQFKVYRRALSQSEIQNIYENDQV